VVNIKRQIIQILFLAIFVFLGFGFYNIYLEKFLVKKNLSYILEKYATDGNKECPINIGHEMIMEEVSFIKQKTIRYKFSLVNYGKDLLDLKELKKKLSEIVILDIEKIKSLEKLRNNDVVFEYLYFDNQKEEMFKIRLLFNTPIEFID
jgi:hypothetical protein